MCLMGYTLLLCAYPSAKSPINVCGAQQRQQVTATPAGLSDTWTDRDAHHSGVRPAIHTQATQQQVGEG